MKRKSNLYQKICSIDNLRLADKKARAGKGDQYGIQVFDKNPDANLLLLNECLINKRYTTSEYTTFLVYEPKERVVFRLPYFPDRIVHHAVMIHLENLFVSMFTADTYSCIKGKGIHSALNAIKTAFKDAPGTTHCLKIDVKKFYPTVDHTILKRLLRRKIKDSELLWLLDGIIDSAPGLPIGNYLSQYLANFYLAYFDHWIKEVKKVKYYFRYADDIVILSDNKQYLHTLLWEMNAYLSAELKLTVKGNYQVFPVAARGVDFVGYVIRHTYVRMRPSIKRRFARAVAKNKNRATIQSYLGWAKHADTKHLLKKLLPHEHNTAA